jgi:WD40 repeat protein
MGVGSSRKHGILCIVMRTAIFIVTAICLSIPMHSQTESPTSQKSFPKPDFVLHDITRKEEKPSVVLVPMKTDSAGKTTGSFAVYDGSSLIHVSSLSFSSDGKLLAVGSTPNIVDIWDVENRTKLRSLNAGTAVALTPDGRILATDGKGIQLFDVSSGKLQKTISWTGGTIWRLSFDNSGTRLLVRANGEVDTVFDTNSGQRLAALTNTQEAQFSRDGSLVIGGNAKHIVEWSTKDWSQVRDLPNDPDYVTRFAVYPENDLIVVGGSKSVRLVRLSSGEEIASLGGGYTNFAAFSESGSLIFTYPSSGFAIWDTTGKRLCGTLDLGNGTVALSANDRWLAAAPVNGITDVMVWNVKALLSACGAASSAKIH